MMVIDFKKDVDGFYLMNVGKLIINFLGNYFVVNMFCGIMMMLVDYGVDLVGKMVVVIGWSIIVGKLMVVLLINVNVIVMIVYSKIVDLKVVVWMVDILVVVMGIVYLIIGVDIKLGVMVIDVGMDCDENGKLVGDVDFDFV